RDERYPGRSRHRGTEHSAQRWYLGGQDERHPSTAPGLTVGEYVCGSIVKRSASWAYVIYLGRDESGRKTRKWVSGFRTKREAEKALTNGRCGPSTTCSRSSPMLRTTASSRCRWCSSPLASPVARRWDTVGISCGTRPPRGRPGIRFVAVSVQGL